MLFQISRNTMYVIKQKLKYKTITEKEIFVSDNNSKQKKNYIVQIRLDKLHRFLTVDKQQCYRLFSSLPCCLNPYYLPF